MNSSRRTTRTRLLAATAAVLPLALAGALTAPTGAVGTASPPGGVAGRAAVSTGAWTPLSPSASPNFATAAVARTPDGLQHVVWVVDNADRTHNYEHTTIDAAGRQGPVTRILTANWSALGTPMDLGVNADGSLRLAFRGSLDGNTANFFSYKGVYTAVSADGGASWVVPREVLAKSISEGGVTMAHLPDGTPITGYGDTGGFHWNVGSIPEAGVPAATVQEFTDHDAMAASLVRSGAAVWVVYQSVRANGVYARQVWPTLGAAVRAPGSYTNPGQEMAVVDRPGVGPVVAYTVDSNVVLWDVLANTTHPVPGMKGPNNVALAVLDDGHLWIGAQGPIGYAPRASRVSARGWTVDRRPTLLPALDTTFGLAISSASALRGEMLMTSNDYGDPTGINARSVNAQLTVSAAPRRWRVGRVQRVRFKATDVDGAVAGVRVRAAGRSCRTNARGICKIRFAAFNRPKTFKATATRAGYDKVQVRLKVKRR